MMKCYTHKKAIVNKSFIDSFVQKFNQKESKFEGFNQITSGKDM